MLNINYKRLSAQCIDKSVGIIMKYSVLFSKIAAVTALLTTLLSSLHAAQVKQIVFEERAIEGKIRKPQLIMIKAEQRPEFGPIVMKSIDKEINLAEYTESPSVENALNALPFRIRDFRVVDIQP